MTRANRKSVGARLLTLGILLGMVSFLTGCPSNANPCFIGNPIVIPSSDATAPSAVLDFYLPNGQTVSAPGNPVVSSVTITRTGTVTLFAKASDPEGVKDVQLWIGTKTCSIDTNAGTETCSGPGLLGAPTVNNPDSGAAGATGCTERLATTSLSVSKNARGSVSYEVSARGVNFGGQTVQIPVIALSVQ